MIPPDADNLFDPDAVEEQDPVLLIMIRHWWKSFNNIFRHHFEVSSIMRGRTVKGVLYPVMQEDCGSNDLLPVLTMDLGDRPIIKRKKYNFGMLKYMMRYMECTAVRCIACFIVCRLVVSLAFEVNSSVQARD